MCTRRGAPGLRGDQWLGGVVLSCFDWMIWKRIQTKAARWEGVGGNHVPAVDAARSAEVPQERRSSVLGMA